MMPAATSLLLNLALVLAPGPTEQVVGSTVLGRAWAGHPVGFAMLLDGTRQFIAWYDQERRMTVASRPSPTEAWTTVHLPQSVGWDSHNGIAMALDDEGMVHLSGNMHVSPLVYYRSSQPYDITTLQPAAMTGEADQRVTYPSFLRGPNREFLFTYRDGGSGNGDQVYLRWDSITHSWRRLLERPLTDGQGQRNAYFVGPAPGPDGFWHLIWVWRESPDCATNHDLSYARSRDLVHWERSDGTPLELPITLATGEVVAPVPVGGGLINGNTRLGFDRLKRPLVSYHRYDDQGHTQLYTARREADGWHEYQTTDWTTRWDFSGGGSIDFEVGLSGVRAQPDGTLVQSWSNKQESGGTFVLDEATFKPLRRVEPTPDAFSAYAKVEGEYPGLRVRTLSGRDAAGHRWVLRWETLDANRDRARPEPWPPASELRLYELAPLGD